MNNQLYTMLADIRHPAYDNDDLVSETPPETPPAQTEEEAKAEAAKSFSQKEMNSILAEDRRKHQEQVQKALNEVSALRSKAKLTAEERNSLDKRIENLQNELLTKEELAKKDRERLQKESHARIKTLESELDTWRGRYTDSSIRRSITDAAVKSNAFNPSQIVALLQGDTRLVEDLDPEGNPTGRFKPKVRFEDASESGESLTLELSPADAVKRMREMDDYLNLFKGEGKGGIGSNNHVPGKKIDVRDIAKDPELYRKMRAEGKLNF